MFEYEPMSEQEAMKARFQLLKDGDYDAVITKAEARMSSVGNNMIEIDLNVYDENGKQTSIKDFWVFTPGMMWKVVRGVNSAGLSKEYAEKKFSPDLLVGRNVKINIATQHGKEIPLEKLNGKPYGSRYPDKNVVEDYWKNERQVPIDNKPSDEDFFNDKIPF